MGKRRVIVGLLEAFSLAEEVGRMVLSDDDFKFMILCKSKIGCIRVGSTMTAADRRRVMELGATMKEWKEQNR